MTMFKRKKRIHFKSGSVLKVDNNLFEKIILEMDNGVEYITVTNGKEGEPDKWIDVSRIEFID